LVDWLQILAEQQCSVVLDAKQPVDNYYIRALSDTIGSALDDGQNLRYRALRSITEITNAPGCQRLLECGMGAGWSAEKRS
ncbi:hypothetical protein P692DRAFT_20720170, partial [Suillus brevipes Sb2]